MLGRKGTFHAQHAFEQGMIARGYLDDAAVFHSRRYGEKAVTACADDLFYSVA